MTATAAEHLADFVDAARVGIDAALSQYLPSEQVCPAVMSEAMRYSVFAGGKRFRPILTLAAADAVSRSPEGLRHTAAVAQGFSPAMELALPAACAVELIHTYSLIHDDLPAMDNDTLRRGRPTLHVVHGDGIAILAGDGLHAEAFTLLAREPQPGGTHGLADTELAVRKLRVVQVIAQAAGVAGMVGGQAIDLQAAGQSRGPRLALDRDSLRAMHSKKTGALIRAAAVAGAIMGGADRERIDAMDRYAADLGLAFQIVDDVLDVEGDAGELGKTTGKDAAGAKPTYPSLFGVQASRTMAAECIARAKLALEQADLAAGWLPAIADWIVQRRS